MWPVSRVRVALGRVYEGRGIQFWVHLPADLDGDDSAWQMDVVSGQRMWDNLPMGAQLLADFVLPLRCRSTVSADGARRKGEAVFSFTLGARNLPHDTLLRELEKQAAGGDPPVRLEFSRQRQPHDVRFHIDFRCSAVLRALRDGDEAADVLLRDGDFPGAFPRRLPGRLRTAAAWLGFVYGPAVWLLAVWLLALCRGAVAALLARLPPVVPLHVPAALLASASSSVGAVFAALPSLPDSRHAAFRLGQISAALPGDAAAADGLLREAATLVGRDASAPALSPAELAAMPALLLELDSGRGLAAHILSFFTLVNLLWLLSIVVIAVSFAPAVYYTLTPLSRLLRRLLSAAWRRALRPLLVRLHNAGALLLLAWLLALLTLAQSVTAANPQHRLFVGLTAVAAAALATFYSAVLYGVRLLRDWSDKAVERLLLSYALANCAALALLHTPLFAWPAVVCVHMLILNTPPARRFDRLLRMRGNSPMQLCFTGACIAAAFTAARLLLHSDAVETFASAAAALGLLPCLGLLLWCASKAANPCTEAHPLLRNGLLAAALLLCHAVGAVSPLAVGLRPAAVVFATLWAVVKYCELHDYLQLNNWLLALLLGCFGYWCALSMHTDPSILINLFS